MLHWMWFLAFGLALLCTPAGAVPCRDDSCQKEEKEDRDASIQLKSTQADDRSYGAPRILVDDLPPGLSEKDELPPGLREKDELSPGLRDDTDGRTREWRKRIATVPTVPAQDPRSDSPPVPEPTGSVLFGSGLLLARAAVRSRLG